MRYQDVMAGNGKSPMRFYIATFGCQMNEYDTELVRSILIDAGYVLTEDELKADIIMLNTCSVRDNAHRKVFGNIHEIRHRRKGKPALFGILGCMATGLRKELLENKNLNLDFVVGPDSYKRLPAILEALRQMAEGGKAGGQWSELFCLLSSAFCLFSSRL